MFLNLVLKIKFCGAVQFVCDRKKGRVLQPDELSEDCMGTINKNAASIFEGKHQSETIPSCAALEKYEETPIFIPVDITDNSVELFVRKLSGSYGPGCTDLEVLHGWLLNFGEGST